jgi:hypothetical protein
MWSGLYRAYTVFKHLYQIQSLKYAALQIRYLLEITKIDHPVSRNH